MTSSLWEDLRKKARTLENQIEENLIHFSKINHGYDKRSGANKTVLNESFDSIDAKLNDSLKKLSEVNTKMTEVLSPLNGTNSPPGNVSQQHTLKRHREILRDYQQEYQQMRQNMINFRNKEELMNSVYQNSTFDAQTNRVSIHLLQEADSYKESEKYLNQSIYTADAAKRSLYEQKEHLKEAYFKMNSIAKTFPIIGSLIGRINLKNKKDNVIIGAVLGVCLFFVLLYLFH